jgi:hypothetical protein
MKKGSAKRVVPAIVRAADEILPEYDFRHARPNPYAARTNGDAIRVTLDPDVAAHFSTSIQVNKALRALAKANGSTGQRRASHTR